MASSLLTLLIDMRGKIDRIEQSRRSLEAENIALKSEIDNLRADLRQAQSEIELARRDAEFLTMSHRLADSPDSLVETRRHIAGLIRTIDLCISMLKE